MTFPNRIVSLSSIEEDNINNSNDHSNSTNCQVIFDVNVLSTNFNKSKEGKINISIYIDILVNTNYIDR